MEREERLAVIIRRLAEGLGQPVAVPDGLQGRQQTMRALMNVRPSEPAADGGLIDLQDAELQLQRQERGIVALSETIPAADPRLRLWQGDITRLAADAVVNAANAQALGCFAPLHACIDNCIHSAAGIQLREECHRLMQGRLLATGDAFVTPGYNLPARHVIHTVGPIVEGLYPTPEQVEQLACCYRRCLSLADGHGLHSIAFCCISTGVFRFPNSLAAKTAVETVKAWLDGHRQTTLDTVVFNVFLDKDYGLYRQQLHL